MQVRRKTIAKLIAVAFVFNLVVMGTGAWLAYEEAPPRVYIRSRDHLRRALRATPRRAAVARHAGAGATVPTVRL